MKILMLTPYLPYPLLSGGQIRTYNLLKQLADKHQITLFALIKEEKEKEYLSELKKYCTKIRLFKRSKNPFTLKNIFKTAFSSYPFLVIRNYVPETISAIEKELSQNSYDLIHAETFYMMPHLPKNSLPTILVEQTIEYLGYESYAKKVPSFVRPLLNIDINKIKKWEKYFWQKCDKLIVMSQEDKEFISQKQNLSDKIEVVANGVDIKWFDQIKRQLPKNPTILSVGTFKWLPNIEAVNFLVQKVWPLIKKEIPSAKLNIVGNAPTDKILSYQNKDKSIKVLGRVADIRSAFKNAHVLVAPVFSGKGTRYKILEAMASGTPVVATPLALEGLNIENGQHALCSKTAEGLADLATQVLTNQKLWSSLSKNGYEYVSKNFDWQLISKTLDNIYQNMGELKKNV